MAVRRDARSLGRCRCCSQQTHIEEQGSAVEFIKLRMSGGTAEDMKCFCMGERPGGVRPRCHMRSERREE